jgi:hypothetical protein
MNPPKNTRGIETPNHIKKSVKTVPNGIAADDYSSSKQMLMKMKIPKHNNG